MGQGNATMATYEYIVSEQQIKKEKEKAKRLRKTQWWLARVGKGICHYCGRKVGRENLTMDHIVPLTRGGKTRKGNVVPACKECNNKKKNMLPIEWKEYMQSLTKQPLD